MSRNADQELLEQLHVQAEAYAVEKGITYAEARREFIKHTPGLLGELRRLEKRGVRRIERAAGDGVPEGTTAERDALAAEIALLPAVLSKGIPATLAALERLVDSGQLPEAAQQTVETLIQRMGGGLESQPDTFHAKCPNCGFPIGNALALGATTCPNCGAKLPAQKSASREIRDHVFSLVCDQLGRAPIGKSEEIAVRKRIYKANPGLAQAALEEERAERLAAAEGD